MMTRRREAAMERDSANMVVVLPPAPTIATMSPGNATVDRSTETIGLLSIMFQEASGPSMVPLFVGCRL